MAIPSGFCLTISTIDFRVARSEALAAQKAAEEAEKKKAEEKKVHGRAWGVGSVDIFG